MKRQAWLTTLFLLAALGLVCLGQYYRLYREVYPWDAAIFFAAGCALFAWLLFKARTPAPESPTEKSPKLETRPSWYLLIVTVVLAALAWQQSAGNKFTLVGVLAWWGAIVGFISAFWQPRHSEPSSTVFRSRSGEREASLSRKTETLRRSAAQDDNWRNGITWHMSWSALAVIGLIALAAFFRLYRLDAVPPEMNSDHVEKLYDVYDVLNGASPIYFERNTGREPMQFYLAVVIIKLFNTGLTHYSLKLTNVIMGVLSVLGVYLLGRELGGKRLGLIAGFFAAVSIWPVATSRIGLRYPFAPAFTSLALWSLWRALRRGGRNDWLLAGLILGLGLHGYTAFRLMPVAAVALIGLHGLAHWGDVLINWKRWLVNVTLYVVVAALVFLPLGHYMVERPQMFWYRTLTRAVDVEHPLPGEPLQLFETTFSRTLGMFNWYGDEVWVCTVPRAPAVDVISGGLLLLGVVYALVYLSRKRGLLAAQLVIGGLILLLPSALNLAFPNESPSVVRAGGAMPIVGVLIALALLHIAGEVKNNLGSQVGPIAAGVLVTVLLISMAAINFQRYFTTYLDNYRLSAMNTREVSDAVRDYVGSIGDFNQVYLKGWPYWLDARALALQVAEKPGWETTNVTLNPQEVLALPGDPSSPRLYILHPADVETLDILRYAFPNGWTRVNHSATPGHDFVFYFVPGHN
jgi:4-amino-4-deoxy-L-arabinose transferase-like glycosyltransferase